MRAIEAPVYVGESGPRTADDAPRKVRVNLVSADKATCRGGGRLLPDPTAGATTLRMREYPYVSFLLPEREIEVMIARLRLRPEGEIAEIPIDAIESVTVVER